jgi:hypothetical protein
LKRDFPLILLLVVIGGLVVGAIAVYIVKQPTQDYRPEDTPAGVVYNYVLALYQADYRRAFGYLAEFDGKPDDLRFQVAFLSGELDLAQVSIRVGDAHILDGQALVEVRVNRESGPFGKSWQEKTFAELVLEEGAWKILWMPYPYWNWDWSSPGKVIERHHLTPGD